MAAALIITSTAVPLTATPAGAHAAPTWRDVVVTGPPGAADAVTAAGGEIIASLPVAGGVAARLPAAARLDARWVVAPQRELRVAAASDATTATAAATLRDTLGLPDDATGGAGVTVAVVDTGIADVPDLAGRISRRLDFTGTGNGDGYGHGTFMAGLIAGSGEASGGAYRGVAPAASLIDIKVADATGSTDLITVLRGLQWVSDHSRQVQVLNLSLSSGSTLPYQVDPLNQALRSLWFRGVTVVVPAGNDGPGTGTVTAPGNDPLLLTVGGLDDGGTAARDDDVVGVWSGRGPTAQGDAKPDLVAPGGHVVSLRSPGSVVDTAAPQARVGDRYFKGSGTSMATAVASGLVAVTLGEQPKLRPDSVKSLFTSTAYAAPGLTRAAGGGAGGLDAARILSEAPEWRSTGVEHAQTRDMATLARDAKQWAAFETVLLKGDAAASAALWEKLSPASREWAARAWAQLDPAARAWAARAWAARAWAGAGAEWAARAWAARAWATRTWTSDEWSARAWAARSWAGADWAARSWAADRWSARSWAWIHPDR
ncbi:MULTISPECIES: S8 family peptidase [Catenuloplanes]|uniref:Serine protease AprX n=1 Tax=Catenuloplanes niger TaxID=587534 RepID=A0AAE3ZXE2_9ACTN|nr:S8 family peptidase [Catenuloplanes niger]MDR7327631.1 serine protease AprX [Catenuloplanes niger]